MFFDDVWISLFGPVDSIDIETAGERFRQQFEAETAYLPGLYSKKENRIHGFVNYLSTDADLVQRSQFNKFNELFEKYDVNTTLANIAVQLEAIITGEAYYPHFYNPPDLQYCEYIIRPSTDNSIFTIVYQGNNKIIEHGIFVKMEDMIPYFYSDLDLIMAPTIKGAVRRAIIKINKCSGQYSRKYEL